MRVVWCVRRLFPGGYARLAGIVMFVGPSANVPKFPLVRSRQPAFFDRGCFRRGEKLWRIDLPNLYARPLDPIRIGEPENLA